VVAGGPTLAVYMPGGNLEDSTFVRGSWQPDEGTFLPPGQPSRYGAASDDLRELVEGFRALPPGAARPALWVAFGGARKALWRGIRYADAACLIADAADEVFGNADCYAFRDDKANLVAPGTLAAFLAFVKARQRPAGPNVLVLWGQGGAHEGLLYDTNTQEIPFLPLPKLGQAFQQAGAHFDVLGMDTGMMANLEALAVLRPFATLAVASPERAPGHGWDYRALVRKLAAPATPLEVARDIADRFIEGQSLTLDAAGRHEVSHRETRGKGIVVVDTGKLGAVVERLDAFVVAARPAWARLMTAFTLVPGVGRERKTGTTEAVDLALVARRTQELVPSLAAPAQALGQAIAAALLYQRRDPGQPSPGQLTIFTPVADKLWRAGYDEAAPLAPAWRAFVAAQVARDGRDQQAPVIRRRRTIEVTDDQRLLRVEVLRTEALGAGSWRAWQSSAPGKLTTSSDGRAMSLEVPAWDGRVLWLCEGAGAGERRVAVPFHDEGRREDGKPTLLSAAVLVRDRARKTDGEDATLFLEREGDTIVDAWIAPVEVDTEGRVLFSREQYRLGAGLSLAFYALEKTDPALPPRWRASDFFDLTGGPRWKWGPPGRRLDTLILASDLAHNLASLPIKP
jgi:hypothetical protein